MIAARGFLGDWAAQDTVEVRPKYGYDGIEAEVGYVKDVDKAVTALEAERDVLKRMHNARPRAKP